MASVTGSGGASMDTEDLKQRIQRVQQDPGLFEQFMNIIGLGGSNAQPGVQVTGGGATATRGGAPITGGGVGNAPVTGNTFGTTGANGAPGSGASSIPPMGAAGGAGGGGRPPVTGTGSPTPPAPGGGSGPLFAGLGSRVQQAVTDRGGARALASKGLGLAGRYAPLIGGGLALMQGDLVGAAGSAAGGLLGSALGPVGAIVGATVGGGAAKALAGGAAKAVEAVTGQRREEGQSGLTGGSIPGLTPGDLQAAETLRGGNVKTAREMLPLYEQYRGVDMQNQMRLNQQLGQLTGALNRQMYSAQLAGGAQQQAGQTVRDILASSNPYAASVFRAG